MACGILVPQPGIEPIHPAVETWSLNHWTAGEVPGCAFLCHIQKDAYELNCILYHYDTMFCMGHSKDPRIEICSVL